MAKKEAAVAEKPKSKEKEVDIKARVIELEGDLERLCVMLGSQFGEPLKTLAANIILKKQGKYAK